MVSHFIIHLIYLMFNTIYSQQTTNPCLLYRLYRIYDYIFFDVDSKNLNFQAVVEEQFGHKKLVELIMMVHE